MKKNILTVTFLSIFAFTSCTTIDSIKPSSDIIKTSPDTVRSTNSGPVIGTEGEEGIHIWLGDPLCRTTYRKIKMESSKKCKFMG